MADALKTVLRIINEAGVPFAPGGTFGPGGEGYLRLCLLRDSAKITQTFERFCD
jgi:aspartate/methionine/tyrosine aminotransferase